MLYKCFVFTGMVIYTDTINSINVIFEIGESLSLFREF